MISLKKHMDGWGAVEGDTALDAYRSLLLDVGRCGGRAVPDPGNELERKMSEFHTELSDGRLASLAENHHRAQTEMDAWAERAFQRRADGERELKEVIGVIAKAMESVSDRDERYAREVGVLTEQLRSIVTMSDLTMLRKSVIESASALTECVERMTKDGRESLHRLSAEVEDYRTRLDKSEKLSGLDSLTGLANRRRFEEQLSIRIKAGGVFSLILIDLNRFKAVNDQFGHLAGDELLKQFATELQTHFRLADLVARWGGDEFAVIVNSSQQDANARMHGLKRNALGEYKVTAGAKTVQVVVDASLGVVQWNPGESSKELVARADRSMYAGKQTVQRTDVRSGTQ
jgi:diguanylate cyclase (GGDEF)-like protein